MSSEESDTPASEPALPASLLTLRSYTLSEACHSHSFHQIILPLQGKLELETDSGGGAVSEHSFAVITAGREHAYRADGENRFLILDVPETSRKDDVRLWDAASEQFIFRDHHLDNLLAFARSSDDASFDDPLFRTSLGNLILHGLAEQIAQPNTQRPETLLRAIAFIHENFPLPVTTSDIANAGHVSVATLNRLFQTWYGRPPARYLGEVRLARAKTLLSSSTLPVSQIAIACGLSEQSAMARAFRRETGSTPGQFRKNVRDPA